MQRPAPCAAQRCGCCASGRTASHSVKRIHCEIRPAGPDDATACVQMRGMTRENAVSPERLREHGITEQTWAQGIRTGVLLGYVCHSQGKLLGYVFGARSSGEVVVLALLPEAESQGLGRRLLALIVQALRAAGHSRLFLGCSPDASSRSYGFYRHLGWQSTGTFDHAGDEVLELLASAAWPANPGGALRVGLDGHK
jgi:GNAT superfamily N-acetyltransferase